jgi:hypothetical protein
MLDLGFEPHIRAISSQVRSDRQTLMFSATWPTAVQQLAQNYLSEPVKVTIGSQDLAASHSVTQLVEVVEQHQRDDRLLALLGKYHSSRSNRIIIFVLVSGLRCGRCAGSCLAQLLVFVALAVLMRRSVLFAYLDSCSIRCLLETRPHLGRILCRVT